MAIAQIMISSAAFEEIRLALKENHRDCDIMNEDTIYADGLVINCKIEPKAENPHYRILYAKTGGELVKLTNAAIKNGWEPTGGLCTYAGEGIFQAITHK